ASRLSMQAKSPAAAKGRTLPASATGSEYTPPFDERRNTMHHVRVGVYTFKPGTTDTIIRKAELELLPMHRQRPGFIGYEVVRTGQDSVVSISTWESQAQAEDAATRSVEWVTANIQNSIETVQNHVGELSFEGR